MTLTGGNSHAIDLKMGLIVLLYNRRLHFVCLLALFSNCSLQAPYLTEVEHTVLTITTRQLHTVALSPSSSYRLRLTELQPSTSSAQSGTTATFWPSTDSISLHECFLLTFTIFSVCVDLSAVAFCQPV